MKVVKVKDYDEMSDMACSFLIEKIERLQDPVLGLATGSTPEGLYKRLIEKYNDRKVSFEKVSTFNLDEYVGVAKDDPHSYHYYMKDKFFQHIDISMDRVNVPSGMAEDLQLQCEEYEKRMVDAGQVDIQVLGIGVNGHIGFNEPGTSFFSRTHIVDLEESTRKANARYFDSIDDVPTQAITMGIETIMDSKEILLLVSGAEKGRALARLLNDESEITEEFPASILKRHERVTIIADWEALNG
ncbi:glucosamine-6-phosphate deaminase [Oceanobacillus massiliensis]|uniref:glucosamine-6-phosphate deaminase n=1 Tax=Oceanobacillus massiliensis TaxID=1465765 RepID=UPI000289E88F|nr:glucosamine-6-phosphate deaminase [Oceanobacillus massiliensis]